MASKTTALLKKMATAAKTNSHRVHVTTRGNRSWAVKKEGNIKASYTYPNQNDAIEAARLLVNSGKATKVIVHNRDGKIVQGGLQE
jgi:hypothetical protein